jgi:hypothetical protein
MGIRLALALLCLLALPAARPPHARAQQPGASAVGTISGLVLDKGSGEPIIDAGVEVVGQNRTARTDIDGRYTIKIAPGTYQVRIFAPGYQSARLEQVVVTAGGVAKADAALPAATGKAAVEVVEVVARADKSSEATQLVQRKAAPVVSETISAKAIKKAPGSDAADVVQRAPAVTVKDDKFVFVRGLNERYTSALLNGNRLPSTDPERRVVPLDLFPASFLDSLAITKTYTADLPGDYAGGLVDLNLRDFPDSLAAEVGTGVNFNTQVTGKEFLTYEGGDGDYLGFGNSFRRLPKGTPDEVPNDSLERFAMGRRFRNIWTPETTTAPPGTGVSAAVGNSWDKFGFQLGGLYQSEYKRRDEIQRQYRQGGTAANPQFILQDDFRYDVATFQTKLGAVLTTSYKVTDTDKLSFRSLINRNSYDETQEGIGKTGNLPANFVQTQSRLRYTEDQLAFGQVAGEHKTPWIWLDWRAAAANTTQKEPDIRHLTYQGPEGGPLEFDRDSSGGLRVFNDLDELLTDGALDFTVPFRTRLPFTDFWRGLPGKVKFGPAYMWRNRDFQQRRFRFAADAGRSDLTLPAEQLLSPENIAVDGVDFLETTEPRDTFNARQEVAAGYGTAEIPLIRDTLRLIAGARVEYSYIVVNAFDENGQAIRSIKNTLDPLPGVNLVYSPLADVNVRLGWSRTVARPEFRELSPVQYPAPRGLRPLIGNPNLVQTAIESYDFRWEWFFSPLELVSLSYFRKTLDQPIEQVVIALGSGSADSFANAESAEIQGFEFEGRKDFGFISPHLKNLSFLTNVTYAESNVIAPITSSVQRQTSTERELQGQAPYVINAALDWTDPDRFSARLLYNRIDSRIFSAGAFGLPDIVEQPRDVIDLVVSVPLKQWLDVPLTAKFTAENILNDQTLYTQGDELQRRYTSGVKFGVGLSYSH